MRGRLGSRGTHCYGSGLTLQPRYGHHHHDRCSLAGGYSAGGFAVYNSKLYILGGFNINVGMVDTICEFNPSAPGWVLKNAHLPTALGYIPTATIGNVIYTAGGSTWDGALHDSNFSFGYDPVADTISNIATILRNTSETRALNFCSQMLVMGGGRDAPNNPSNEVDVYDPVSNSWLLGQSFLTPRRDRHRRY